MNFIENETDQKLRGGYYTPPRIAKLLTNWIAESKPSTVLEPSCGDGVFLSILKKLKIPTLKETTGFEIDLQEAEKAKNIPLRGLKVIKEDFLKWYVTNENNHPVFDATIKGRQ